MRFWTIPIVTLLLSLSALGQDAKIAWHGTWQDGLAAAKAAKRPILLVSAAPHCKQIPGIW